MSRAYSPRRQSARWRDGDCPAGVLAIYDDGPNSPHADRYTVFYAEPIRDGRDVWIGYRAMSANPFHPQGIGLYCEMRAHEVAAYRYRVKHRAARWSSLPADVQRAVRADLEEVSA